MPNPGRTPTVSINLTYAGAATEEGRFRENLTLIYTLFTTAGWTVPHSSTGNGGGSASASDLWAALVAGLGAGFFLATGASGPRIVFESPAGYLNTGTMKVMVQASANATPFRACTITQTTGAISGLTSTTVAPTTSTVWTSSSSTATLYNSTGTMYHASYYTSRGDVRWSCKLGGNNSLKTRVECWSNEDGDGEGEGDQRAWIRHATDDTDCQTSGFYTASYVKCLNGSGAATGTASVNSAAAWVGAAALTGGVSAHSGAPRVAIEVSDNSASGRYLGTWVDTAGAAPNLPFGELDASESAQTYRAVCTGDVWEYVLASELPHQ